MVLVPFPQQRPLCVVGRLGRQKKRAHGARWEKKREKRGSRLFTLPIVPRALSVFSIIAQFFYMESLAGAFTEERGAGSNFIVLIPSCSIHQMLANFAGVEFQKTVSNLRKRKTKLSCVHVLHET